MPKVSIVVPVYNVGKYLERCLNSLVEQTLDDIEIICVDDGSTDNSAGILDKYAATYKKVKVVHEENHGVSMARNIGMDISSGDYIGFVDSDDYVSREMFLTLYNYAILYNVDIVQCGSPTKGRGLELIEASDISLKALMDFKITNSVWNKLYKREIISNIWFSSDLRFAEDFEFVANVLLKSRRVLLVPEKLYCYETRELSETRSEINDEHLKGFRVYDFLKNNSSCDFIRFREISESLKFLNSTIGHKNISKKYTKNLINRIKIERKFISNNPYLTQGNKVSCFLICFFAFLYLFAARLAKKVRSLL